MTLYEIVGILKKIALTQPNVKSATDGSIYDVMNATNSVKYDVVHLSQTKHITNEETDTYGFNIFYVSRLEDSLEDNRLQIQSIGKEVLDNILRTFCENWNIDYPEIIFYPFTQKFADLCAGVYCRVEIEVPKDLICADDYIDEITPSKGIKLENIVVEIDQNGTREVTPSPGFDGIGKVTIVTDVSGGSCNLEYKEVEYTESGEYTILPSSGYDGLSEVAVSVNVDCYPSYEAGYEAGYLRGERDQQDKLTTLYATNNGTYSRDDGYRNVIVDVQDVPVRIEDEKQVTESAMTYEGGYYYTYLQIYPDDGYDVMRTVNLLAFTEATEAIADGENRQKAKLVTTSITRNGVYEREDGYSAVYVDVPDTYLAANLQGDYFLIPSGTTHLRDYAFYNCCFSSITIPDTVTGIGSYAFATADESACLTGITIPSSVTGIGSMAFYNQSGITEMTFTSLVPPTLQSASGQNASLGQTGYTYPIYVPCASIDAYKAAFGEYAPRIQCIPTPPSQPSVLDFTYSTTTPNQMVILFGGDSQTTSQYLWDFYSALEYMEIDGNIVEKDITHITPGYEAEYYWYTFPTSGTHNVKYYVSADGVNHYPDRDYPYYNPGTNVLSLLFADSWSHNLIAANIGDGYEKIIYGAFTKAQSLVSVTMPSTMTEIGSHSFQICTQLETVTINAVVPPTLVISTYNQDPFYGTTNLQHIYVPSESVNAYKTAPVWSNYANIISAKP